MQEIGRVTFDSASAPRETLAEILVESACRLSYFFACAAARADPVDVRRVLADLSGAAAG